MCCRREKQWQPMGGDFFQTFFLSFLMSYQMVNLSRKISVTLKQKKQNGPIRRDRMQLDHIRLSLRLIYRGRSLHQPGYQREPDTISLPDLWA